MPQGPSIKPITGLIVETYMTMYGNEPKVTAKEVAHEVRSILKEKDKTRRFPEDWPGDSAVGKIITDIKKNRASLFANPKDEPWTLSTLKDYFIAPEILPTIIKLQAFRIRRGDLLTIREAIWAGRFYYICKEIIALDPASWEEDEQLWKEEEPQMNQLIFLMWGWAIYYSRIERREEVLALLDKLPSKEERLRIPLLLDSNFYANLSNDWEPQRSLFGKYNLDWPGEYEEDLPGLDFVWLSETEFKEYLQGLRRKPRVKEGLQNERSHT
jgi:hypothetical protein